MQIEINDNKTDERAAMVEAAYKYFDKWLDDPDPDNGDGCVDIMADFALEQIDKALAAERKRVEQAFTAASESDKFASSFGDGTVLTGLPPNDIYQLGFMACYLALKTELGDTTK